MSDEVGYETPDEETLPPLTEKQREAILKQDEERRAQQHEYFRKRDVWPRRG